MYKTNSLFFDWSFGSINIRTGKEKSEGARIYMITKEIARKKLLFCSLQEVRYRNNGHKVISLDSGESYVFLWSGRKKRRDAGVGLIIKLCNDIAFDDPDIEDPRLMAINLTINGLKIRLVNAYAPTNCDGSEQQKDLFYRLVKKGCMKQSKHQKLIITGDFNATTSTSLKQCYFDGNTLIDDELCNDNGFRVKNLCREFGLCMTQSYFNHPLEERYTWFSGDNCTKKVLDYVLVEHYVQELIKDCHVDKNSHFESDHRLLITDLCTPKTRKARKKLKKKPHKTKPDIKALQNCEIEKSFATAVTQELKDESKSELSNEKIVNCLLRAADKALPKKEQSVRRNETWKNDEILNKLLNDRMILQKRTLEYTRLTRLIKKRVNILRNNKFAKEASEINEFASRRKVEELYRSFKSDNSSFTETKAKKRCDLMKLREHFKNHFTSTAIEEDPVELILIPDVIEKLQNVNLEINSEPPTTNELVSTIKKLKCGKSSNDIPVEYIKHSLESKKFVDEITKLFETIWVTKAIPSNWSHSKLITLWKGPSKGKADDPTTYRGIQIGSSLCKIMITIIINRLQEWYEQQLMDQQQGFRSARGTTDGIYITKRIQQITSKMKKATPILFVDLTAAFDHVERKWLFATIEKRFPNGAGHELVELLKALYSYTTTALAENPEDKFELNVGVRQGGAESPMLYNLYMDFVMRIFLTECKAKGIKFLRLKYNIPELASRTGKSAIGNFIVDWCGYADDLLLVFDNEDSLRRGVKLLDDVFRRYRLNINISKTKTMILNQQYEEKQYPTTISSLRGIHLDNVTSYHYLGCEIKYDEASTGETELNLRADAADCKFYSLSRNLFNMKIQLKTRILMLNSLVRSIIVYACQTWSLTNTQLNRLNSQYVSFIRKMVKGGYKRKPDSWSFVHTNENLLKMAKTMSLTEYVQRQQLKYFGHIVRADNSSIVKRLTFNNDVSRRQGRQTTLKSAVIANSAYSPEELYERAMNREY